MGVSCIPAALLLHFQLMNQLLILSLIYRIGGDKRANVVLSLPECSRNAEPVLVLFRYFPHGIFKYKIQGC